MTVKCKLPYLTGTSKFFPRPLPEISKLTFHNDVQPAIVKADYACRVKPGEVIRMDSPGGANQPT
jgi:hypothetical protein